MKNLLFAVLIGAALVLSFVGLASALTELPDPNQQIPGAAAGETVAFLHDDFYAYSARLNTWLGYDGFDVNTGTGGLDLLIYTGAGGQNNDNIGAGGAFDFPDPLDAPGGNVDSFMTTNVWGLGDGDHGPVTVDYMVDYLHQTFGPQVNVPVFDFDMNQTGNQKAGGEDIFVAGKVELIDPNDSNNVIAVWALDGFNNNVFDTPTTTLPANPLTDPSPWVYTPGLEAIKSATTGYAPPLVSFNMNLGSGSLDYIGIAPTMDLSQYTFAATGKHLVF